MSREIKFRAFSKVDGGRYDYGGFSIHATGKIVRDMPWIDKDATIEQYTGLKDSDGVEIYEGDIVQFTYWWFDGNHTESQLTGQIVYSNELMSCQMKGVKNKEWERFTGHENDNEYLTAFSELQFEEDDFKVLGNVHQHPNLLEGE